MDSNEFEIVSETFKCRKGLHESREKKLMHTLKKGDTVTCCFTAGSSIKQQNIIPHAIMAFSIIRVTELDGSDGSESGGRNGC